MYQWKYSEIVLILLLDVNRIENSRKIIIYIYIASTMKTIAPYLCLLSFIPASITQDCKFIRYLLICFLCLLFKTSFNSSYTTNFHEFGVLFLLRMALANKIF